MTGRRAGWEAWFPRLSILSMALKDLNIRPRLIMPGAAELLTLCVQQ
jgi:hypothetical protein